MKSKILLITLFLLTGNCLAEDLTLTNLQFKTHYELVTNWSGFTNYFTAHVGYSNDTNKPIDKDIDLIHNWGAKGCVISNNILDVYYKSNNQLSQSVIIDSVKILEIEITQEQKIIYKTNYNYIKNPEFFVTPHGWGLSYKF